jgi:hypothetical protein
VPASVLNNFVKGGTTEKIYREREVINDKIVFNIDEGGFMKHTIKGANRITRQAKRFSMYG